MNSRCARIALSNIQELAKEVKDMLGLAIILIISVWLAGKILGIVGAAIVAVILIPVGLVTIYDSEWAQNMRQKRANRIGHDAIVAKINKQRERREKRHAK